LKNQNVSYFVGLEATMISTKVSRRRSEHHSESNPENGILKLVPASASLGAGHPRQPRQRRTVRRQAAAIFQFQVARCPANSGEPTNTWDFRCRNKTWVGLTFTLNFGAFPAPCALNLQPWSSSFSCLAVEINEQFRKADLNSATNS